MYYPQFQVMRLRPVQEGNKTSKRWTISDLLAITRKRIRKSTYELEQLDQLSESVYRLRRAASWPVQGRLYKDHGWLNHPRHELDTRKQTISLKGEVVSERLMIYVPLPSVYFRLHGSPQEVTHIDVLIDVDTDDSIGLNPDDKNSLYPMKQLFSNGDLSDGKIEYRPGGCPTVDQFRPDLKVDRSIWQYWDGHFLQGYWLGPDSGHSTLQEALVPREPNSFFKSVSLDLNLKRGKVTVLSVTIGNEWYGFGMRMATGVVKNHTDIAAREKEVVSFGFDVAASLYEKTSSDWQFLK